MIIKNQDVYMHANELGSTFIDKEQKFPIKINFYLQKNIKKLTVAAQEVEEARLLIAQKYGIFNSETNTYIIAPENINTAQQELNDLLNLEQDIPLHIFSINDFENVEPLTYEQMSAIMFMIKDDEE